MPILPTAKLLRPNLSREFVPQGLPPAVIEPRDMLFVCHSERGAEEVREGAVLAQMEARGVMAHLSGSALNRFEGLQAGDQLAGGEHAHRQSAARHGGNPVGEQIGARAEPRQTLRPSGDHAPFGSALADRRAWKCYQPRPS